MTTLRLIQEFIRRVIREELKARPNGLRFEPKPDWLSDDAGWRYDEINAYLPGYEKPVGYIKMRWVSRENFERIYTGIIPFLRYEKELTDLDPSKVQEYEQEYGDEFREFEEQFVDKPLVDFIYVDDNLRRKGIGIALYEAAAKYLAKMGLRLYASYLQHDNAVAAWQWLKNNAGAKIGTDNGRLFLSYL